MSIKCGDNFDLGGNQLLNALLQILPSDPSTPGEGQIWYSSTLHAIRWRSNSTTYSIPLTAGTPNTVSVITDGTNTYNASGATTLTFATANNRLSVASASGTGSADTVTFTINEGNFVHNNLSGLTVGDPHTQYANLSGRAGGQTLYGGTASGDGFTISSTSNATKGTITLAGNTFNEVTGLVTVAGRITGLATPTAGSDAVNKSYVDSTVQGLTPKPTATVATSAALPANAYANGTSGVGATLTASSGTTALVIDGVNVVAGNLVLVKNEATTANNGLYTVTNPGGSAAWVLTRHVDMDQTGKFLGAMVPVGAGGTANSNSLWMCNPVGTVTVGTTGIPFTQLNGATDLIPGTAISISGNTISGAYTSGTGITITGASIAVSTVPVANGGTGAITAAGARANLGTPGKYATTIGDGTTTSFAITHGLGTRDVTVAVYDANTYGAVLTTLTMTDANNVTVAFSVAPTTNQYRVVVIG